MGFFTAILNDRRRISLAITRMVTKGGIKEVSEGVDRETLYSK
jgi:hypothetical protein